MLMQKWLMLDSKWLSAHARPLPPRGKFQFRAYVPRRWPSPVLVADKPWEKRSLGSHTLHFDSGRYRMWYEARDETSEGEYDARLCYADSDDLLTWRKPELGLVEYGGSKRNNIVFDGTMAARFGFAGHCVCLDPGAPRSARYRMIYSGCDGANPVLLTANSPDGLVWQLLRPPPGPRLTSGATNRAQRGSPRPEEGAGQIVAFWDATLRKYVGYFRSSETGCRVNPTAPLLCIARAETQDFDNWPRPVIIRTPDEADGPDADLVNGNCCRYESGGDVAYLMFLSTFHRQSGRCEVQLATSRDGVGWQRLSRTAIISDGMVFACPTLVPFRGGLALSYGGVGGIGVVEFPTDRFQGLWAVELEATLASFLIGDENPRLRVNAVVEPGGEIRGALTIDAKPIPGCDFSDCAPVAGDSISAELGWKDARKLLLRRGREVQLRLRLRRACLYAIAME